MHVVWALLATFSLLPWPNLDSHFTWNAESP